MTALKKGIALIMLTLVMLVGSVAQTFAASAETIKLSPNSRNEIKIEPGVPYRWELRSQNPGSPNAGFVDFGGDVRLLSVNPSPIVTGFAVPQIQFGLVVTNNPATFTWEKLQ